MTALIWQWQWREPLWLWVLLYPLAPLLLGRLWPRATARLIDRALWPWMLLPGRELGWRRWPFSSLVWWLAWSCLVIALAGPRQPDNLYRAGSTALRDVMVVVDVSRSMTAGDVAPSRLRRARLELASWLPQLRQSRLGLVVYGARPHLVAPLTDDLGAFRHYLAAIADDVLPTEGSDPIAALALALQQLPAAAERPAALLLLSDGGYDHQGFEAAWSAFESRLRARGVRLYAMGMGTPQGAPLLAPDGGWLQMGGTAVVAQLQEARLRRMAEQTGGAYARVAGDDSDWDALYGAGIARLGLAAAQTRGEAQLSWREYHRPFLVAAVFLMLLSLLRSGPRSAGTGRRTPLAMYLVMGLLAQPAPELHAEEAPGLRQADAAYGQQAYELALGRYARLPGYRARMGEASAAYRLGRYPRAMRQYTLALLAADSDRQRADALYDLANCRFQLGDYAAAERIYRDVLRYVPQHPQATTNLAIASSLREAVDARLAAGRPGRGPRSGRAAEGLEPGEGGLSLGKEDKDNKTQPFAIHGEDNNRQAMIERGIRYSTVASSSVPHDADRDWQYEVSDLQGLGGGGRQTGASQVRLWRRLFEGEEGFPAPQARPHPLPGRLPW